MKMKQEESYFESNIESKTSKLTILATSKAMEILSKGIYSRPVEACLRELSTNAYDAHVEAGIPNVAFEVMLPTYSDAKFSVRDFGNGLPPEKIREIFATYFSSSKTDSNETVGCLGLGSKSPLAVADQFNVEMWRDGWYYLWTIYRDENGFPTMQDEPIIKRQTTEPQGIRVCVPVDYNKRHEFAEAAKKVYPYFKTIPTVKNGPIITTPVRTQQYETFWLETGSGVHALMGNVVYPINSEIKGLEEFKNIASGQKIIIPFAIGDLEFDASRENLTYNSEIIAMLKIKYREIISELSKTVSAEVNKGKNGYEAIRIFNDKARSLNNNLANSMYNEIQFKGAPLNKLFDSRSQTNWDTTIFDKCEISIYSSYSRKKLNTGWSFALDRPICVFYNDDLKNKSIAARLEAYIDENKLGNTQVGYLSNNTNVDKWCELNHYDRNDIKLISALPKIAKSPATGSGRKRAGVFTIKGGNTKTYFWQSMSGAPDKGYYFVKSDDDIVLNDKVIPIVGVYEILRKLDVLPPDLYGISKSYIKDYKDDDKFIPADGYIIDQLKAKVDDVMLAKSCSDNKLLQLAKFWPTEGAIFKQITKIKDLIPLAHAYSHAFTYFGIPHVVPAAVLKYDDIVKLYPMLKPIAEGSSWAVPDIKDIQAYIRDVAKAKNYTY